MDFPTKQKLHIKSWISRLSKKAQTDRLHKEFSRSFFFFSFLLIFHKTNPRQVSSSLPVLAEAPTKKTIYRRVEPWQAPWITSLIPTAVEADVLSQRGVTDVCFAAGVEMGTHILLAMSFRGLKIYTIKQCKNVLNFVSRSWETKLTNEFNLNGVQITEKTTFWTHFYFIN